MNTLNKVVKPDPDAYSVRSCSFHVQWTAPPPVWFDGQNSERPNEGEGTGLVAAEQWFVDQRAYLLKRVYAFEVVCRDITALCSSQRAAGRNAVFPAI